MKNLSAQVLLQNVIAGLIVSVVALSLGASLGILSGRGAFAGMLSAGIIAFITSLLGGTRVQCSGPTAPMSAVSAVVIAYATEQLMHDMPGLNPDHFINLTFILTGGLLLLIALLRLGRFISLVPNVVISGFMNGIAVLIWVGQLQKLFGWGDKDPFTGALWLNVMVVLVTLVLIFLLPWLLQRLLPKIASFLSGTLLTIVIVSAGTNLLHLDIEYVTLTTTIHSWDEFSHFVVQQVPTDWSLPVLLLALPFALQLTLLCYLDTLLTSLVVDKMTKEKSKQNQELMAQGIANATMGFLGGIPGAQATIRSVLIIKEKATLRLAGILVGIFVILEMLLFQNYISLIPQAVFAGILFKVGYDVFDWTPVRLYLKELIQDAGQLLHNFFARHDDEPIFVTNREMLMIIGTTVVTVLVDLNVAVIAFTLLFYGLNRLLWPANPMRDLLPTTETQAFQKED